MILSMTMYRFASQLREAINSLIKEGEGRGIPFQQTFDVLNH